MSHVFTLRLTSIDGDRQEDADCIRQLIEIAWERFGLRCLTSGISLVDLRHLRQSRSWHNLERSSDRLRSAHRNGIAMKRR